MRYKRAPAWTGRAGGRPTYSRKHIWRCAITQPYHRSVQVWTAKAASATLTYLPADPSFPVENFGQIRLAVEVATFSGTLSFEWSADGSNWHTLPYFESHTDAKLTAGVVDTQPSFTLESGGRLFVVPGGPFPHFRIVMTRTAGSITALLQGYEHDSGYIGSR